MDYLYEVSIQTGTRTRGDSGEVRFGRSTIGLEDVTGGWIRKLRRKLEKVMERYVSNFVLVEFSS